jgi:hypothetical protein
MGSKLTPQHPVKIPVPYLDTSVIGGYFDDEFKEATRNYGDRYDDAEEKEI